MRARQRNLVCRRVAGGSRPAGRRRLSPVADGPARSATRSAPRRRLRARRRHARARPQSSNIRHAAQELRWVEKRTPWSRQRAPSAGGPCCSRPLHPATSRRGCRPARRCRPGCSSRDGDRRTIRLKRGTRRPHDIPSSEVVQRRSPGRCRPPERAGAVFPRHHGWTSTRAAVVAGYATSSDHGVERHREVPR